MQLLQTILPILMAIGTAMALDRLTERKGLLPPNFDFEGRFGAEGMKPAGGLAPLRSFVLRSLATGLMALVLWLGVFAPLGLIGRAETVAPESLTTPDLFLLHAIFLAALAGWYLLGFTGSGRDPGTAWIRQLGLATRRLPRELGIGLAAGILGWVGVVSVLFLVAMLLYFLGGEDVLPSAAPEIITWVVGLPIAVRVGLAASAGVVEELFFRGFLQPRVGILLSSVLFVLAHLSYEQPFLLIGVALLSVLFAFLVRWRQNIWAAVVAHAVFDAIQLLIVIPRALQLLDEAESAVVAAIAAWLVGV